MISEMTFEWLVTALLSIIKISNVLRHNLQYVVHALKPFFNLLKIYQPVIVKYTVAFGHVNYFLKKRIIDKKMGYGQRENTEIMTAKKINELYKNIQDISRISRCSRTRGYPVISENK